MSETRQMDKLVPAKAQPSLAKASGSMAIATLASRITGFLSRIVLVVVVGSGVITDSYQVGMTIPLQVYELLLGGVLTSIIVPLLVRAEKEDADGGEAYIQRLLTMAPVILLAATVVMMLAAPLLTTIYVDGSSGKAHPELATAFAYLLLPEIVFFGLGALFTAILNSRGVFGLPAWAPVFNNLVVLVTLGVYLLVPGDPTINPLAMSDPKLLVLGIGTTLGIVVQALVVLPAMRRAGIRFKWRWGWDRRLTEFGGLALWMVFYVVLGLAGVIVVTRIATAAVPGSMTAYNFAWQLFQLPYGILGFSLLTAIMPRMSKAAADNDVRGVVADLSLGSRLLTTMLLPLSAGMTVLGSQLGVALFFYGANTLDKAQQIGTTLAVSAFGLVPYAITMMQLRVFYAMKDARTPAMLQLLTVAVKIGLSVLCVQVLDEHTMVLGLAFVNSMSFLVGAVAGNIWLRVRLGRLETGRLGRTFGLTVIGSLLGALSVVLVHTATLEFAPLGTSPRVIAWVVVVVGGLLGLAVAFGSMMLLKVTELNPAMSRITRLLRRR
ncbi:murein biosynthesis integral membrane protein MurJ [Crossiella sp. CA-258035]|uniref:murein biosynthesis integral membrane protein MurJ n=1 Tax=Crossiella sp. CA-258035 TaxID=2981138 RepID=UPI0024BD3BCD|nr:murein biosynthesis integral membrane protein MurJ [Crossiella sp. CA-258035]WHT19504.1 murein biosynthesis integral membrane protein MurJ [Crossiella sp. CA-258035]